MGSYSVRSGRPTPPPIGGSSGRSSGNSGYTGGYSGGYSRPTPPSVGDGYSGGGYRPTPPAVGGSGGYRPTPPSVDPGYYRPTPPPVDPGYYRPTPPPVHRRRPPIVIEPTPWYYTPQYYPFPLPQYPGVYSSYAQLPFANRPSDIAYNFLNARSTLRNEYYETPMTSSEYRALEQTLVGQAVDQLLGNTSGYPLSSRLDALTTIYDNSEMNFDQYTQLQQVLFAQG